jgi:hypothetical protein
MPVVHWDWAYRTGYASTAISVVVLSAGLAALTALILRSTRSVAAALVAPAVILLNPNVLYLQSTPMTEPLLIGLALTAIWLVARFLDGSRSAVAAGVCLAALALTRYEGWFVAGALVLFVAIARRQSSVREALALAPYLLVAVAAFLLLSKGSTGVWFVTSGFFEPDADTLHRFGPALDLVWRGTAQLGGVPLLIAGLAGTLVALAALFRGQVGLALPLALLAAVLLPLYAFFQGHPFRVRYMVPVVVALAALAALAIGALPRRLQAAGAVLLLAASLWIRPPFDPRSAMVQEAQWEAPYRLGRRAVTSYLVREWDGTPILASMGSLGHYMQEAAGDGFAIAHFVHEGNGDLWLSARTAPTRYVEWMLIEERAEGGDELAARARTDASFLAGMERVAEGGGVALYRRR